MSNNHFEKNIFNTRICPLQISWLGFNNSTGLKEIDFISATPTKLSYSFSASEDQLVVFSEIYYPNGWYAEIDGKVVNHFPVNYVLRGMLVPAGKHTISFRFDPQIIKFGVSIRMICLLYTSPSPRDATLSRMPSSA